MSVRINQKFFWPIIFLIIFCSSLYVVSQYRTNDISGDEIAHVATGMEWWENGTYYLEALHPPLARVMVTALPYLSGERLGVDFYKKVHIADSLDSYKSNHFLMYEAGTKVFFGKDEAHYRNILFLSRLGNLAFFIVGCLLITLWSRRLYGDVASVCTTIIFAFLPIILTNAMLATTDMAMATCLIASLMAFEKWIAENTKRSALLLGIAFGLLCASKLSGPIFFLLLIAPLIMLKDYANKKLSRGFNASVLGQIGIASLVSFVILWAVYRFDVATLDYPFLFGYESLQNFLANMGFKEETVNYIAKLKLVPFPEFFHGLADLTFRLKAPFAGYIFEQPLSHGVWYFFMAATLFKMPISFLLLVCLGSVALFRQYTNKHWYIIMPLVYFATLYLFSTTFDINIGLRHILPVFFFGAILAGFGASELLISRHKVTQIFAALLMIATIITPTYSNPISYFNLLAGDEPEKILVDNDLDIGQELTSARDKLREMDILKQTKFYPFAFTEPKFFGFPASAESKLLDSKTRITFGKYKYVMISVALVKILSQKELGDIYGKEPYIKLGKTFWVYKK